MGLPRTFFLRLDSHQAAIVVGIFELLFHVPFFFVLVLIKITAPPTNELSAAEGFKNENEERDYALFLHMVYFFTYVEIFNIISSGLIICAVIYKKKLLVLPWFIITAIDILSLVIQYVYLVFDVTTLQNTAVVEVILFTIIYFMIFSKVVYSALAVFRSYRDLANPETPNRNHAVKFQPVDNNGDGLV